MRSAHGKILLFGEHAVVHGTGAIAAGLSLGVDAEATPGAPRLSVPAWGLDTSPAAEDRPGRAFAALLGVLPSSSRGFSVRVDARVPAGAGLGSSAAMSVSVARALLEASGVEADEALVFEAAMASERVFHGNPSGLDHTVAMRGGLLHFVRGTPPVVRTLTCSVPLEIVVAQVAPGADTGRMVGGVGARRSRFPRVMESAIASVGAVVEAAESALATGDRAALGELMDIDHGLLVAFGVSTAALDAACHVAREAGALGAKLTGAGGGGCMIALAPPGGASAIAESLRPLAPGVFTTTIGASTTGGDAGSPDASRCG